MQHNEIMSHRDLDIFHQQDNAPKYRTRITRFQESVINLWDWAALNPACTY